MNRNEIFSSFHAVLIDRYCVCQASDCRHGNIPYWICCHGNIPNLSVIGLQSLLILCLIDLNCLSETEYAENRVLRTYFRSAIKKYGDDGEFII